METDEEVWPLVPPICQALTAYLATLINSPLDWVPHLSFCFLAFIFDCNQSLSRADPLKR